MDRFSFQFLATKFDYKTIWFAIAYLAIPNVIFAIGYYRPFVAICVLGAICWLLCQCFKMRKEVDVECLRLNVTDNLLILAWAFLFTIYSGAGSVFIHGWDWYKHNAMIEVLLKNSWPVMMGEDKALVYYIGYYMPFVAAAKLLGAWSLRAGEFLWMFFGLIVILRLVTCVIGSFRWYVPILMFCFTPLVCWQGDHFAITPGMFGECLWTTTLAGIRDVPQHYISGFIATCLMFDKRLIPISFCCVAMCAIFSPFVFIGLMFWAGMAALRVFFQSDRHCKRTGIIGMIMACVIALPVGIYLASNKGSTAASISGFVFASVPPLTFLKHFVHFSWCVVGVWLMALISTYLIPRKCDKKLNWLLLSFLGAWFCMLLTFRMGNFDFPARATIPFLVVLLILCCKMFVARKLSILAITFLLGAIMQYDSTINLLAMTYFRYRDGKTHELRTYDPDYFQTEPLAQQYINSANSAQPFTRFLSR